LRQRKSRLFIVCNFLPQLYDVGARPTKFIFVAAAAVFFACNFIEFSLDRDETKRILRT
jgi:hypothetical protein